MHMYTCMYQSIALHRSVHYFILFWVNCYQRKKTNLSGCLPPHPPFQTLRGFLFDHKQPFTSNSCKRKELTRSATTCARSTLTFFQLCFMVSHIAFLCMVLTEMFSQFNQGIFRPMNLDLNPATSPLLLVQLINTGPLRSSLCRYRPSFAAFLTFSFIYNFFSAQKMRHRSRISGAEVIIRSVWLHATFYLENIYIFFLQLSFDTLLIVPLGMQFFLAKAYQLMGLSIGC